MCGCGRTLKHNIMNNKFKNYPVNIFAGEIVYNNNGEKDYIETVEQLEIGYLVVTNHAIIEISNSQFNELEYRVNETLNQAAYEDMQRAYYDDMQMGFHQH